MNTTIRRFARVATMVMTLLAGIGGIQHQIPAAHAGTCTPFVKATNNSSASYQVSLWWDGAFSSGCQSAKAETDVIDQVSYPQSDSQILASTGGIPTVLEDTGYKSGNTVTGWWGRSCSLNSNNVFYEAVGNVKDLVGSVWSESTAQYNRCQ